MFNKLFEDNYKDIYSTAKKIVRKKSHYGSRYDARELMNEAYLILHNKEVPNSDKFLERFSSTMKYLFIGERSTYNKNVNTWILTDKAEGVIDEDWIKRVCIEDVVRLKEELPAHLKAIFELHYEQGLSSRKIAHHMEQLSGYKMERKNYGELINEVKLKIKQRWPNLYL